MAKDTAQSRLHRKNTLRGLVQVKVWIPIGDRSEITELAARKRAAHLKMLEQEKEQSQNDNAD